MCVEIVASLNVFTVKNLLLRARCAKMKNVEVVLNTRMM